MRSSIVALSSFVLTSLVVWGAYSRKKQFYPTVIYLTNNQTCLAVLLFQCAVLLMFLAKVTTRVFFGRLQQAEVDNLVSQSWYAFFDMCLVFAFFQDELGTEFLFLFTILLFVRAFHWLIEERVDYMERTPVINALFHIRVLTLISLLCFVDVHFVRTAYMKPATHGLSVHLALGIEYYILLLSLFSTTVRYMLHTIDSFREHPWDKKTTYLLYVDIVVGILRLALYIEFTLAMWSLHPFPLFIARPIYLSVRALKKAVRDVLMSRRAIRYMNTVFRDATSADLAASSDTVCIICREEMQASSGTGQQNPSAVLKRLPCSHIFHVSCLRSWFQRQQTCPTCRMDIIRQVRLQENQAQGRGQASRAAAAGSGNGASAPASANSETQAESGAAARPPWMPNGGQFPMFPPFLGGQIPNVSTASQPQGGTSPSGVPSFPPMNAPFFPPPLVGMPIIYPGNLFPNATTPMPEPPSSSPDSISEARLRASAEARFTALRQINVLLNAAILQMNTYLSAVSEPGDVPNPWVTGFASVATTDEAKDTGSKPEEEITEKILESNVNSVVNPDEVTTASTKPAPGSSGDNQLSEVRRRRLERFGVQTEDSLPDTNSES